MSEKELQDLKDTIKEKFGSYSQTLGHRIRVNETKQ